MIDQQLLVRIDQLIAKGEAVRDTTFSVSGMDFVENAPFAEWRNQSFSLLTRLLGASDTYTNSFAEGCKDGELYDTERGLGILRAVREDVQGGHLATLRELVHADVFSDFLEMAEYLMAEDHGYKDPAAVLAGGVLEEHLRQLCQRHSIATETQGTNGAKPKKADTMNADLTGATIYNKNQQKIITGWLGTRNSAAHGR